MAKENKFHLRLSAEHLAKLDQLATVFDGNRTKVFECLIEQAEVVEKVKQVEVRTRELELKLPSPTP